jgi:hypothetical protein
LYGPKNALDIDNDSNCWNSEGIEGATQYFELDFGRMTRPQELRIQFQAGFFAQSCSVQVVDDSEQYQTVQTIEFDDVHSIQIERLSLDATTNKLRLVFDDFTDFYGRLIVYRIEVWGDEGSAE